MIRAVLAALMVCAMAGAQEFRGHGGPVRALAISIDGTALLSGSFDGSAILWDLRDRRALSVMRGHEGAVNAVGFLGDGRMATGGADGRILLWRPGQRAPEATLAGHVGQVTALAASADGARLASVGWDGTVRLWTAATGAGRVIGRHTDRANAVAFLPDGDVVSAGADLHVRVWGARADAEGMEAPVNAIVPIPQGVAFVRADGYVGLRTQHGRLDMLIGPRPLIGLAASRDGSLIALARLGGSVALLDVPDRRVVRDFVGPGTPIWAVAFAADGQTLYTGGQDGRIRRWSVATGQHLSDVAAPEELPLADHQGARAFRACVACHALQGESGNRAGPTLAGLFGRRIATVPDFDYSPALRGMDIVWSRTTVADLFTRGPSVVTPGTRMPEQVVRDPAELAALLDYLEATTR
jgi:cytochrome c